jgi:general secretion pathway protein D
MDLDIQQEVSNPETTTTGVTSSPTISTRRVETKLSLRDGSTVLLAGLIQRNSSGGNSGVPFLKDIPVLGSLFRSENASSDETELLVMITPYVINDDYEAEGISDAMQAGFGDWAQDIKKARLGDRLKQENDRSAVPVPAATEISAPIQQAPPVTPPARVDGAPVPVAPAATGNIMEGITTTAPPPKPAATPAVKPTQPTSKKAEPASKPEKPSSATPPPANAPIKGGQVVEDEKVKEEIKKLFEGKR